MISIDTQIHGYRKGHQLLASTITLPKDDQAIVDRLSDVAGPLRPKEVFAPYLSAYPLPSGTHYVIAKTWQDLSVSRAGCVRTKSLLVNAHQWSSCQQISTIIRLLGSDELPLETDANRIELDEQLEEQLPFNLDFNSSELIEALFLEESKPIVIFDAPEPEQITLRLLSSLWPSFRMKFAVSTFALSPRKIGGRDLDLLFVPSSARARFSDWAGRRVDGSPSKVDRHRWTKIIIRRVFEDPNPRLLTDNDVTLLGGRNLDGTSALRVVLLWTELLAKLEHTPMAILGLVDIASSGLVDSRQAFNQLEKLLVEAVNTVMDSVPISDAWAFAGAITLKTKDYDMPECLEAVGHLVTQLVPHNPGETIKLLQQLERDNSVERLLPSIALGLCNGVSKDLKQVMLNVPAYIVASLIAEAGTLFKLLAEDNELIEFLGEILTQVDQRLYKQVSDVLLPYLTDDRYLPVAIPVFRNLNITDIAKQLHRIGMENDFEASLLSGELLRRAHELNGLIVTREVLVAASCSSRRCVLLDLTLGPTVDDVIWVLENKRLTELEAVSLIISILKRADESQFSTLFSDSALCGRLISLLPDDETVILERAALQESIPINIHIQLAKRTLPKIEGTRREAIAEFVLQRCLCNRFGENESQFLHMLFGIIGDNLNAKRFIRIGIVSVNDVDIINRNLIVFENSPEAIRKRLVTSSGEIAKNLRRLIELDLSEAAYGACASILFDAEKTSARKDLLHTVGWAIPLLLRARTKPVSLVIAALFPIAYQELAKSNEVPELMKFFFFLDWDKCRTARNELVESFMTSSWYPGDLALVASRCGDVIRILKVVRRFHGGEKYLYRIANDLARIDVENRKWIQRLINDLLEDK